MLKRYRRYRSYGHGVLWAASLAPPPEIIFVAAIVAGIIIGVKF